MTNAGWVIRFYLPFDAEVNTFVGNYSHLGARYLDDIVVFSGMYGLDYMKWYVHDDLVVQNYRGFSIDFKIYADSILAKEQVIYQNTFRIIDVSYDENSSRYVVFSISQDSAKLLTNNIKLEKSSLKYDETRGPEKLLKEVLHDTGVFVLDFHEHDEEDRKSFQFEYSKFTFDPTDTLYDFINYVAVENNFEWACNKGFLFIGPELRAFEELNAEKPFLGTADHISIGGFTYKTTFPISSLDILYNYGIEIETTTTQLRCIWAKHQVGRAGDMTKGCFVPIGTKIDKEIYRLSLEGDQERMMFDKLLYNKKIYNQMRMGRITEDSGDSSYVDIVSIEKSIRNYTKKTPRNQVINTTDPIFTLPRVGRTAEYLDDGAGQLFPRANNAPNSIIYAINDRIEQTVKGPFVMGNGDPNFVIINKGADDYRFTLPNGWTMYVKSDGEFIMDFSGVAAGTLPTEQGFNNQIHVNPTSNTISIHTQGTVNIGANATAVNLSTGANSLAHGSHTHNVPGVLLGGPGTTTGPSTSNTTTTKAD